MYLTLEVLLVRPNLQPPQGKLFMSTPALVVLTVLGCSSTLSGKQPRGDSLLKQRFIFFASLLHQSTNALWVPSQDLDTEPGNGQRKTYHRKA